MFSMCFYRRSLRRFINDIILIQYLRGHTIKHSRRIRITSKNHAMAVKKEEEWGKNRKKNTKLTASKQSESIKANIIEYVQAHK